jgi:hypothetical protein
LWLKYEHSNENSQQNQMMLPLLTAGMVLISLELSCFREISSGNLISIIALALALATFWWINLRKGKLIVPSPRSLSICGGQKAGRAVMRIPLTFYNDGALPLIVRNMRIRIDDGAPIPFLATAFSIESDKKGEDNGYRFATQFPIEGRNALHLVAVFIGKDGMTLIVKKYTFVIESLLADSNKWNEICRFQFNVKEKDLENINSSLLAYDLCDE